MTPFPYFCKNKVFEAFPYLTIMILIRFWRKVGMKMVDSAPVVGDGKTRVALGTDEESIHKEARER